MDTVQKDALRAIFDEKKAQLRPDLKAEYGQIADKMLEGPPERMAQCMLQEESPRVNAYIRQLRRQLQQQTSEQMQLLGVSQSAAGIVWAEVKSKSELPKASLCERRDVMLPSAAPEDAEAAAAQKRALGKLESVRNVSASVAVVGAVATVVTCLVVPGWPGATGAVLIVVGAGAAGAIVSQQRIAQINRIARSDAQPKPARQDARELAKQVCTHQCQANVKIIERWLDAECQTLIAACERELAR